MEINLSVKLERSRSQFTLVKHQLDRSRAHLLIVYFGGVEPASAGLGFRYALVDWRNQPTLQAVLSQLESGLSQDPARRRGLGMPPLLIIQLRH
jgi:hypothetical protein